jgi:hypothetical protein
MLEPSALQRRGGAVDSAGAFAAVESTATRAPPLCALSGGAHKRALSAQGHVGSCVPLQLPAELPFLQNLCGFVCEVIPSGSW